MLFLRDFKKPLDFELPKEHSTWKDLYKTKLLNTFVVHTIFTGDISQKITKVKKKKFLCIKFF